MTNPQLEHVYILSVSGHDFQIVLGVCDSLEAADYMTQEHCSAIALERAEGQVERMLPIQLWGSLLPTTSREQMLLIYRENPDSVNNEYLHLTEMKVNEYGGRFGQEQR